MRVVVLTSSRADYSIYLPLLKKLKQDPFFSLKIIAFGTHLSKKHGYTINPIIDDGFNIFKAIKTPIKNSNPVDISKSIGKTISIFSKIWEKLQSNVDLIICLGDRYEMFAAVTASIPFQIPIAHICGGDTTTGAIDNIFRHSITLASKFHFTTLLSSYDRVCQLIKTNKNVYNVGSLSIDSIFEIKLLSKDEFSKKYNIPLNNPLLVTFHPETISYKKNKFFVEEVINTLKNIPNQIIITMPNSDTTGSIIRKRLIAFAKNKKNVFIFESLGVQGYYSCIKHCDFLLGNSSSGIIEAASFGKYVINIGDRQKGREAGVNVIHSPIKKEVILNHIKNIPNMPVLNKSNIYGNGKTADKIISTLKEIKND